MEDAGKLILHFLYRASDRITFPSRSAFLISDGSFIMSLGRPVPSLYEIKRVS